jgi:general secretion pathway protein E
VNEVGFTKPQLTEVEKLVERLDGLVLVTGPKESGVSSLLYAMLRSHDAFMRNIHTMETLKLMDVENVTQHVHDSKGGQVSFGRALQSVLRTDPDIVMVADCLDSETASLCADYALQKKMYLGMRATNTFEGLRKYMQLVGDNQLVARGLQIVTCCRLVRKLCTNCRKGYRPDLALLKKANLPTDQNRPFYRPPNREELEVDKQGNPIICPVCQGSGYLGRTGIYEVLVVDDALRGLVSQGAPLQAIKAQARKGKMPYLQEVGLQKVMEGLTSINEVLRVTREDEGAAAGTRASA